MQVKNLVNEMASRIRPFLELECAGGKLYWGSMFYVDFGAYFNAMSRKGETIEIGEMTLSVRDVNWSLFDGSELSTSAELVNEDTFGRAISKLRGQRIENLSYGSRQDQLEIRFSSNWRLVVDLANEWQSEGDVFELVLPDGQMLAIGNNGKLIEDAGTDPERARHWATSRQ